MKKKLKKIFSNRDCFRIKNEEQEILNNFIKENFLRDIQRLGFDVKSLEKSNSNVDKEIFNYILSQLKNDYNYNLVDCVLFLEEDYIPLKKLLLLLDERNIQSLKEELSKKYFIPLLKTKIDCFLI